MNPVEEREEWTQWRGGRSRPGGGEGGVDPVEGREGEGGGTQWRGGRSGPCEGERRVDPVEGREE